MKLCKNTSAVIVLPETPLPTEQFAAEELAKYLKQSMGIDAPITNKAGEGVYSFVIGCPARNAAACAFIGAEEFAATVPGPEGLYINITEQGTLLAGSEDDDNRNRGTLYALYEYLERYFDCNFGAYTKPGTLGGEMVPAYDELNLPSEVYCKAKCDVACRSVTVQYNNWVWDAEHELNTSFFDYLIKNRYNIIGTWAGVYHQWKDMGLLPELEKRGLSVIAGHHHALETWLPAYGNKDIPIRYVEEHPEYFRLEEDGSHWHPDESERFGGQLAWCCNCDEMIEELGKNIVNWLDKNPVVDNISFPPNDFRAPQCCCDKCKGHTKMENYLAFGNKLVCRIRRDCPKVSLIVSAYSDLWECPENFVAEDGLKLNHTVWAASGLRKVGNPDGSGMIGSMVDENATKFLGKINYIDFYEYYMGIYGNRHYIMPAADEMQAIAKYYVEKGFAGSGTQFECFNLWNNLLNFYCFARTGYDTELSLEDNIRAIGRLFGTAADTVGEIFHIYEDTLNGEVTIDKAGFFFREHVDVEKVYALFDKALDEAGDSGTAANNVRLLRMAFRYTMLDDKDKEMDAGTPEGREMIYMCRNFNSYLSKSGHGISVPVNYYLSKDSKFGFRIPEDEVPDLSRTDKWYAFA